jgi:uncharacterized protein YbjT (DUF2867 family)
LNVAVFGATGTIGTSLLPRLAREHDVVAISRTDREDENRITWCKADATDANAVRRALDGVDVVYYLVHSLGKADFEDRDLRAAETTSAEAADAGVQQIVYLGGLADKDSALSPHLRSRLETGRRLEQGAVPVTTLRAAMIVGRGSAAFEVIVALVDRLPAMICPRWVGVPTQPIALRDAVAYLARVCGLDAARGRGFDIGGPEVMTYRQMIERIAAIRGKKPLIVEVPFLTPRLSSYWLHLVTPVKAGVARPIVEGLRSPTVVGEEAIATLVPLEPMPFEAAVREALADTQTEAAASPRRG